MYLSPIFSNSKVSMLILCKCCPITLSDCALESVFDSMLVMLLDVSRCLYAEYVGNSVSGLGKFSVTMRRSPYDAFFMPPQDTCMKSIKTLYYLSIISNPFRRVIRPGRNSRNMVSHLVYRWCISPRWGGEQ